MEEDVAREHDARLGRVHHEIALGVRRADVDDIDRHAIEVVTAIRVEHGRRRRRQDDIGEVERRELMHQVAEMLGWIDHRADGLGLRRREIGEAFGTSRGGQ